MPTNDSKLNPNLTATNAAAAAAELVSQQAEQAAYSSSAAGPDGNMSGMPKSEAPSIPASLSQPRVQVLYALYVSLIMHGRWLRYRNFTFTTSVIRISPNCCVW